MKYLFYITTALFVISCTQETKKSPNVNPEIDSTLVTNDTIIMMDEDGVFRTYYPIK